jgi:putative tryptophan/tyrosine transport system substrate-binding protein
VRRRDFIAGLASAPAWPMAAPRAQQSTTPVIGFVRVGSPDNSTDVVVPFLQGLKEAGYVDGQNTAIEFRWVDNQTDQLSAAIGDLVRRRVTVIAANGNSAAVAAKAATNSIPVVFVIGGDPVGLGLVASLNRPGGNVTGVSVQQGALVGKQLELLRYLVPKLETVGYLVNPTNANSQKEADEVQAAGRTYGLEIVILNVSSGDEFDRAFATAVARHAGASMIGNDPVYNRRYNRLAELALGQNLPVISTLREYAFAGGLISYGTSVSKAYRLAGVYAGRILGGEKPAALPVELAARIELVVNLKAAKAIGLVIPELIMVRADEVIE